MFSLLLLACTTSPSHPVVEDADILATPDLATELRLLHRSIGRARQNTELACAAITKAVEVATLVETAKGPDGSLPDVDLHGVSTDGSTVTADWTELAIALGPGDLAMAVVTVGGLQSVAQQDCIEPKRVESWTRRLRPFANLDPCVRDVLLPILLETLSQIQPRCTCTEVPSPVAARISARLTTFRPALSKSYGEWTTAKKCPASKESPAALPAH